eukprot:m.341628 g.341628  ORF g.341628 m.341628 type:complete len:256 (+) comp20283_c0_seq1:251-1018(+)
MTQYAPIHKRECSSLEKLTSTKKISIEERRMSRFLLNFVSILGHKQLEDRDDVHIALEHVMDLMSAEDTDAKRKPAAALAWNILSEELKSEVEMLASKVGMSPRKLFREILAKLPLNSFGLWCEGEMVGMVLCPAVALCNHSCIPNAAFRWEGRRLILAALSNILVGEEIYITYIDLNLPYETRKETLCSTWKFVCQCWRCTLRMNEVTNETVCEFIETSVCVCGSALYPDELKQKRSKELCTCTDLEHVEDVTC